MINLNDLTIKFSNELVETDNLLLPSPSPINEYAKYIDNGLTKLSNLLETEKEGIIIIGSKIESEFLLEKLEHAEASKENEIIHSSIDNSNEDQEKQNFFPEKFLNRETKTVYWNLANLNDINKEISLNIFLYKIFSCLNKCKVVIVAENQPYEENNEHFLNKFLENKLFDYLISCGNGTILVLTQNETLFSIENVRSNIKLFLSSNENLENMKRNSLEYLSSENSRLILLNKSESDFVFKNPEKNLIDNLTFELIEGFDYIKTSSITFSNNLSNEDFKEIESILEETNIMASETIKNICDMIKNSMDKYSDDLAKVVAISFRKDTIDSIKCTNSIIADLIRSSLETGKEFDFFKLVNEKIPLLLNEENFHLRDSLEKVSFYYQFFRWIQYEVNTDYYLNLKKLIDQFKDLNLRLTKVINREELKLREMFNSMIQATKEVLIVIRNFYTNRILYNYKRVNGELFMNELNAFQTRFTNTIKSFVNEKDWNRIAWLKMIETIEQELFAYYKIDFKIAELKTAYDLKLAVNEYSLFETEFVKSLDIFENELLADRHSYLNKCFLDFNLLIIDQIEVYKENLKQDVAMEKSFKNILAAKNKFETISSEKECLKDFIQFLKEVHPLYAQEALLKLQTNLKLLFESQVFGFLCNKDSFQKELLELNKHVNSIFSNRCDTLFNQLLNNTKIHLDMTLKDLRNCLIRLSLNDSKRLIDIYQIIDNYLIELNISISKTENLNLIDMLKELKKNLVDKQSLEEKIIILQIFDKLMHSDLSFFNENPDVKHKFLNDIYDMHKMFERNYAEVLVDKLNFVWSIMSKNVESIKFFVEKKYVYDTMPAIKYLMEFTSSICNTKTNSLSIVEIMEHILEIEEKISKDFLFLEEFFDFKAISEYLIGLMKSYNIQQIKLQFNNKADTNLLYYLIKTLHNKQVEFIEIMKTFAKNALYGLKADLDDKIQKIKALEQFDDVIGLSSTLLASFETLNLAKDVRSFSIIILEKSEDFLSENTKACYELIKNDAINDTKCILGDFNKLIILPLQAEIVFSKNAKKAKNEIIKVERIKECLSVFIQDIENCVEEMKDIHKCFILLDSSLKLIRKIKDNMSKTIEWLCMILTEFWKIENEKEPLKSSIKTTEIKSRTVIEALAKENFSNSQIPQANYNEVKIIFEKINTKHQFYDKSIKENEENCSLMLKKAVDCFINELNVFLSLIQKPDDKIVKLIEKVNSALKSNMINEIASFLIFDFENTGSIHSSPFFEEIIRREDTAICFINQMDVKKTIQKLLENTLKDLLKKQKELQVIAIMDTTNQIILDLYQKIEDLICKEIEKATGMKSFINFLEQLKISINRIDHDKINYFATTLENFMLEYNLNIEHVELIRDKKLDFFAYTKINLVNLIDYVRRRVNWYKLLRIMFEKMNEGRVFDSVLHDQAEDSEYLMKTLRKLNISFEKGVFNQILSNWNQSLTYQDLNEIIMSQLLPTQKAELELLNAYSSRPFDVFYNQTTKHFIVNGNFILMSNVVSEIQSKEVILVIVIGNNGVYFDTNIKANGVSFFIITPLLYIQKPIVLDISGLHAKEHEQKRAKDGNEINRNGENGLNGNAGQDAGHFYGIFGSQTKIETMKRLIFLMDGGNGSSAQDGGDGFDGQPGKNALPLHIDNINNVVGENIVESLRTEGIFKKNLRVFHSIGTDGQMGGNAGNGGNSGGAGLGGKARILHQKKFLNCEGNNGKIGGFGKRGNPGNGGKNGIYYESVWDIKNKKWNIENKIIERGKAAPGNTGSDGNLLKLSNNLNLKISLDTIKFLLLEVLNKKVFLEKNDISLKLQFDFINKFHDDLQIYSRKPENFIRGENFY